MMFQLLWVLQRCDNAFFGFVGLTNEIKQFIRLLWVGQMRGNDIFSYCGCDNGNEMSLLLVKEKIMTYIFCG